MVGEGRNAFSLWGKLEQVLKKFLNEQNGSYAEEAIHLILLFLESSILDDRSSNILHSIPLIRSQFIELEQMVLKYFFF